MIVSSCKHKTKEELDQLSFDELISESDRLIIKLYDSTAEKKLSRNVESLEPKIVYNVYEKQIRDLTNIFKNAKKTGYCCCPTSSYSISFLKDNDELDIFYADTLEFKNNVRVYEGSYQYSFIIEKQKWKNFLNQTEKTTANSGLSEWLVPIFRSRKI